jgi:hypothetical protein
VFVQEALARPFGGGSGGRSPHLEALARGAGVSVGTFTLHMHKRLPLAQAA